MSMKTRRCCPSPMVAAWWWPDVFAADRGRGMVWVRCHCRAVITVARGELSDPDDDSAVLRDCAERLRA